MSEFEVAEPILNSPFEEPRCYWYIREGETPEKREGRRPAFVFPPRDQTVGWTHDGYVLRPSKLYPAGYDLAIKGGTGLQQNQTLADAGVKDGDTLRIIPATDAGCCSG